MSGTALVRLYQIHDQEQEIVLEKVSGTLRHQVFAEFSDASKVPDTFSNRDSPMRKTAISSQTP